MASTYTDIGTELMTTGENAGNWGTKTNTNIKILEEALRGYVAQSIAGSAQTTALTYSDGSTGDAARNMVIALTGSITGNQVVTVTAKEKLWIVDNQTSGAYTVQFMVSGQTGVTWATTDKGTKILYCNGTDVIDSDIGGVGSYDLNGEELTLDADSDTSITASTDDQIDFEIAGADDFTMTANAFNVLTGSHATFADSANAKFGTGNDMLVYHDGSNSYITNATGALKLATETSGIALTIGHTTSETTIADNLTTTGDTSVGGTLGVTGVATFATHVALGDSDILKLGAGTDLTLYHDGTNSYITNAVGALKIATETSGIALTIGHTTSETTIADNLTVTGTLTGTLATAAQGSVTSLGTLTTLTVDNVITNGATIGHTSDTDLLTLADGALTVAGTIGSGAITSTGIVTGTAFTAGSAVLAEAELELLDGLTAGTAIASKVVTTDSSIDTTGQRNLTISGELDAATLDISGNADIDGTTNLDAVDIDGAVQIDGATTVGVDGTGLDVKFFGDTAGSFLLWDQSDDALELTDSSPIKIGDGGDMQVYHDGTNSYITNSQGALKVATETSGIAVTIGHSTSEVTVADNLTVTGTLTLGSGAELTEAELEFLDGITAGTAAASKAMVLDASADITGGRNLTISGELDAATGDFSGDVDVDGTLEADAITIGSTAIGSIYGVVAGSSSILTTGALDTGSITSGFGAIDNGTSNIRSATITAETAFVPDASGGADLGTTALEFNDAFFNDSAVINFGDDQDTTLTHTDGTGLTLNSTNKLCFYDTALYIHSSTDGQLDLVADTEIQIAATTIDINGAVALNGAITGATDITLSGELDAATLDISGNADIDGTTNLDAVDIDGAVQIDAAFTSGVDGQGYDTKFFGDTSSAYMLWDTSADDLVFAGAAGIDLAGDIDVDGTANLDVVDIDGAVDMASTLAVAGVSSFAVAANVAQVALTSSSNAVAWDASAAANAYHLTTENTTISAPSNAVEGAFICLELNHDGTTTVAWNAIFNFAADTAPTTTDTNAKTDILVFRYNGAIWQEVGRTLNIPES